MILVDTTVLVYAVGEEHPLRAACRDLLEAHGDGRLEITTTVETIEAFLRLRLRGQPDARDEATALARHLANALRPIVTTRTDLERALNLLEAHPALAPSQATLAAVALGHDAEALVSADSVFETVPGLHWVAPGTPAATALLELRREPIPA